MKSSNVKMILLLVAIMGASFCTSDVLDDGDGADVVMLIEEVQNEPVTAALDQATGFCTFTEQEWKLTIRNSPKNSFAGETPFQDIIVLTATLSYDWYDTALVIPDRVVGLGNVAIHADDVADVTFYPLGFQDVDISFSGTTANVTILLTAVTVEGTTIYQTFMTQLMVESCA